jgi:hypothetical protein
VAAADRPVYSRAARALAAGDAASAWETAHPLFDRYRDVLAVQDLRCQIAMRRGLLYKAARAECDRLMDLSTKPAK